MDSKPVLSLLSHTLPFWREDFSWQRPSTPLPPPHRFDDLASQKVIYTVDSLKLVYLGEGAFRRRLNPCCQWLFSETGPGDKESSCCQVMTLPGPTWERNPRHLVWRGHTAEWWMDPLCPRGREGCVLSVPERPRRRELTHAQFSTFWHSLLLVYSGSWGNLIFIEVSTLCMRCQWSAFTLIHSTHQRPRETVGAPESQMHSIHSISCVPARAWLCIMLYHVVFNGTTTNIHDIVSLSQLLFESFWGPRHR